MRVGSLAQPLSGAAALHVTITGATTPLAAGKVKCARVLLSSSNKQEVAEDNEELRLDSPPHSSSSTMDDPTSSSNKKIQN